MIISFGLVFGSEEKKAVLGDPKYAIDNGQDVDIETRSCELLELSTLFLLWSFIPFANTQKLILQSIQARVRYFLTV